MSESIPESIPTSADPRSKRPVKKRAISPRSQTAAQVDALFAKPDQEIRVPSSTGLSKAQFPGAPPEIVANVQGSSAGAGSGEFHVYKASRRREYERLKAMDEEVRGEKAKVGWDQDKAEREDKDRERTRKNREKREKLKSKKNGKKGVNQSDDAAQQLKANGLKARVDVGDAQYQLDSDENGEKKVTEEQVGIIIHDDD